MPNLPKKEPPARKRRRNADYEKRYAEDGWRSMSWDTQQRYKATCAICGSISPGQQGAADHIVELDADGAKYDPMNLWWLCVPCHAIKSRMEEGNWHVPFKYNEYNEKIPKDKEIVAMQLRSLMGYE